MRQVELRNLIKDTQALKNNDEIANAYDHLTPPDYPIAYRAKKWFFCDLPFFVNRHVLVPRSDTEVLAMEIIKHAEAKKLNILDLCTGSGCIAIALARHIPASTIYASDVCRNALKVAKKNATLNKVRIRFIKSNLFEKMSTQFDIIVSNPPYIKTSEIGKYDDSILQEPRQALDGGADGLDFYRRIIIDTPKYLNKDGILALEVGDKTQAQEVKSLLQAACFNDITIVQDRVVHAKKIN